MANVELYEKINDEYTAACAKIFKKIIVKQQNEHQHENHKNIEPNTQMKCIICKGRYTLRTRSVHNRTVKHMNKINEITDYVNSH